MIDFTDLTELRQDFRTNLFARGRQPSTVTNYMEVADQFIEWLREHKLSTSAPKVTRKHIERYLADLASRRQKRYTWKPVSPATVARHYRTLQQFFKFIETEGIVDSPMAKMSPPKVDEKAVPVLTEDEIKRLLATCKSACFRDRRDYALFMFMLDTGARVSEIVGIRVETLDFTTGTVMVLGKGRRERVTVFGPKTSEALRRYLRVRGNHPRSHLPALWLGERSSALTDHGVRDILNYRAKLAKLSHVHPHQFRHTFAHRFLSAGGQETDLMLLAGWRSRQMVGRYGASMASERAAQAHRRLRLTDGL